MIGNRFGGKGKAVLCVVVSVGIPKTERTVRKLSETSPRKGISQLHHLVDDRLGSAISFGSCRARKVIENDRLALVEQFNQVQQ